MLLRDKIGKSGTMDFEGFSDLSLTELLPAILTRYSEAEMVIVAPAIPDQAAEIITAWMDRQWSRSDGRGKLSVIRHLTIIADFGRWKSPMASQWLKDNPFGERLTLIDRRQDDTIILLPDFAIDGPVNMRYGRPFTATATTDQERVKALWDKYTEKPAENVPAEETSAEEEEAVVQEAAADPEEDRKFRKPAKLKKE